MTEHRLFPYLMILGSGAIWGVTFSFALIATAEGAHPLGLSAWQVVLTALFFLIACLVSRVTLFDLKNLRHYVVLALVGITAPNLLYYYAAPHLSAGILAITVSTVPLFTYAIMLVLRFESVIARRLAGIVLGMTAILLLVVPDQGLSSDDASFWILLVVVCALLYAVENVYIGRGIPAHIDIREFLFGSNLVAILLQFPLAIYLGVDESWTWLATDAGVAVIGIAVGSGFAYSMFFYTIKTSGPVFASQCAYVVTISGVIWGIIIFAEQHTVWIWISVIVMLLGLVLVTPDEEDELDKVKKIAIAESS
ncbi:MAG: DMT family transporter [Gammaproteobacteria bacterium]|nr:DMT family transporter [Gammaproteobacteria bacterium]MDH3537925.1 DMT family transporter [Gammaproteobacteria bacterium]